MPKKNENCRLRYLESTSTGNRWMDRLLFWNSPFDLRSFVPAYEVIGDKYISEEANMLYRLDPFYRLCRLRLHY